MPISFERCSAVCGELVLFACGSDSLRTRGWLLSVGALQNCFQIYIILARGVGRYFLSQVRMPDEVQSLSIVESAYIAAYRSTRWGCFLCNMCTLVTTFHVLPPQYAMHTMRLRAIYRKLAHRRKWADSSGKTCLVGNQCHS